MSDVRLVLRQRNLCLKKKRAARRADAAADAAALARGPVSIGANYYQRILKNAAWADEREVLGENLVYLAFRHGAVLINGEVTQHPFMVPVLRNYEHRDSHVKNCEDFYMWNLACTWLEKSNQKYSQVPSYPRSLLDKGRQLLTWAREIIETKIMRGRREAVAMAGVVRLAEHSGFGSVALKEPGILSMIIRFI